MSEANERADWFRQKYESIRAEVAKVIVGQETIVECVLIGLAADGHVLLEGMPGLGKTMLVKSLAESLSLSFSRIQFTPDLMPADVTGTNVLVVDESGNRRFEFRKGPIFANLLLADEINRATPKTQSAMLEAMQERAVTAGGARFILEKPFLVMATQNPVEQEGTYPLPEAQLDRFLFKVLVPFPTKTELATIMDRTVGTEFPSAKPVANGETILKMRDIAREVVVGAAVQDFALSLIVATHPNDPTSPDVVRKYVRFGASPRGAQALLSSAKVKALLDGRFHVAREDVLSMAPHVLRHRLLLNFEADADGVDADQVVRQLVNALESQHGDPIRV